MDLKGTMLSEKSQSQNLYTLWFYLCNILEMTNYRDGEEITGCQGMGGGRCD